MNSITKKERKRIVNTPFPPKKSSLNGEKNTCFMSNATTTIAFIA